MQRLFGIYYFNFHSHFQIVCLSFSVNPTTIFWAIIPIIIYPVNGKAFFIHVLICPLFKR